MRFRSMFFQVVLMVVLFFSSGVVQAEGSGSGYALLKNALGIVQNKTATVVISMNELIGKSQSMSTPMLLTSNTFQQKDVGE